MGVHQRAPLPRGGCWTLLLACLLGGLPRGEGSLYWTQLPNATWTARADAVTARLGAQVFIAAGTQGFGTYEPYAYLNDVWSTTDGVSWTCATPSAPWGARIKGGMVAHQGELLVVGGQSFECFNDVWVSGDNGTTWAERTGVIPWAGRYDFGLVSLGPSMLIIGGANCNPPIGADPNFNSVFASGNGSDWVELTPSAPWSTRSGFASAVASDQVFIFGGLTYSYYSRPVFLNDVWVSANGTTWTQVTESAAWSPRTDLSVVFVSGLFVLEGGATGSSNAAQQVWLSEDAGASWNQAGEVPWGLEDRQGMAVNTLNGTSQVLFMGGETDLVCDNAAWSIDVGLCDCYMGDCNQTGFCTCWEGYTNAVPGGRCDLCATGYMMASPGDCAACPGGAANPCNGHGECTDKGCACKWLYAGESCAESHVVAYAVIASSVFVAFVALAYFLLVHRRRLDDKLDASVNGGMASVHLADDEMNEPLLKALAETLTQPAERESWIVSMSDLAIGPLIGSGAGGQVFAGVYASAEVAIKRIPLYLDEDAIKRVAQEAKTLASLSHPHVLRCLGIAHRDTELFVITERCARSLHDLLASNEPLDHTQRLRIALQVAHGLQYLHARQIIHRDVKPDNVLLDVRDNAKIADFGSSRLMTAQTFKATALTGTIGYMAPELITSSFQSDGVEYASGGADVFSFGVMLNEMAARERPFIRLLEQETTHDVLNRVVNGARPRLALDAPQAYIDLIVRCWDQDPRRRPPFSEIVQELQAQLLAL